MSIRVDDGQTIQPQVTVMGSLANPQEMIGAIGVAVRTGGPGDR